LPELPEVETVRRGLAPVMEGHVIARAEARREGLRWPFPAGMSDRLTGARVLGLRRRSKYILGDLDTGETLLIHLGMSGRMLISGTALGKFHNNHPAPEKHDHVVLDIDTGARITFNDPRRFGAMDLFATGTDEHHPLLARLGPEPLGNSFHEDYLIGAFAGRKTPAKAALLDQRIVAGLGNIYVCEALHRAHIRPAKPAGRISIAALGRLVPAIKDVLTESIRAGGSTIRDYAQPSGELGYFAASWRVYGKEGQPCPCGGVVERLVQGGRSTFWCRKCQK
jgi:formamidopyrimidine-DNA glycosylase